MQKVLEAIPGAEIILRRARPGHTVFHYRFTCPPGARPTVTALERGVFTRQNKVFCFGRLEFPMQTAYGLPEFDSLDYRSELIIKAIDNFRSPDWRQAAVINPGQGHLPVAIWKLIQPGHLSLVDRDLLALRYANLNLALNGCSPEKVDLTHQVPLELKRGGGIDLWAGVLREEEGTESLITAVQQAASNLSSGGLLVLSAGSTAITRLSDYIRLHHLLRIEAREKWRGYSLLVLGH